jgi:hypothetical protein
MSMKLTVGICQKIGQPDYGSLAASCNVEVELDPSIDLEDLAAFRERVEAAYSACRQAVEDELAREQASHPSGDSREQVLSQAADRPTVSPTHGQSNGRNGHSASQKQLDYCRQLASQIRGLGERRLEALSQRMFSKSLGALSSLEASGLIDVLKEIKAGKIDLNTAIQGESA